MIAQYVEPTDVNHAALRRGFTLQATPTGPATLYGLFNGLKPLVLLSRADNLLTLSSSPKRLTQNNLDQVSARLLAIRKQYELTKRSSSPSRFRIAGEAIVASRSVKSELLGIAPSKQD